MYKVSLLEEHKQVMGETTLNCLRLFVVVYELVISASMNSYHGKSVNQVLLLEDPQ